MINLWRANFVLSFTAPELHVYFQNVFCYDQLKFNYSAINGQNNHLRVIRLFGEPVCSTEKFYLQVQNKIRKPLNKTASLLDST
jgi:hypothetical protein